MGNHKPLSEASCDSQHLEVVAQRIRAILSSALWSWMSPFISWMRPSMATLRYKTKHHPYFSAHSLDIRRSTAAQHSALLVSEQSTSSAGMSGTKSSSYSPSPSLDIHSRKLVLCPSQWHSWGKGIMVTKHRSQSLNSPFPSWHSSTENREILLLWECRSGKDLLPLASSTFPPS